MQVSAYALPALKTSDSKQKNDISLILIYVRFFCLNVKSCLSYRWIHHSISLNVFDVYIKRVSLKMANSDLKKL